MLTIKNIDATIIMPQLDLIIFVYQLQILAVFIMGYFVFLFFFFSAFNKTNKHFSILSHLADVIAYVLYIASYGMVNSDSADLELKYFEHKL